MLFNFQKLLKVIIVNTIISCENILYFKGMFMIGLHSGYYNPSLKPCGLAL